MQLEADGNVRIFIKSQQGSIRKSEREDPCQLLETSQGTLEGLFHHCSNSKHCSNNAKEIRLVAMIKFIRNHLANCIDVERPELTLVIIKFVDVLGVSQQRGGSV